VVLVIDGALAAVPFAALFDSRRGRYLVEDHPLRFAVSLREAQRPSPLSPAGGALFVADPAFDRRQNPLLDRLPQAGAEVRQVVGEYAPATVLDGAQATRSSVMNELSRAAVIHFAGHAVFDDARPERSYLVLAPDRESPSGRITAAELGRLDLRHVRLVVLSACKTVRGGRSRASGYTGLSGALLAAGAGGTIGSTWSVDDSSTALLMTTFHRGFQRSRDGPGALRTAQLSFLRSGTRSLRSPAAWAAFRYAGR
jgi:CHAT domain-containing protein